MEEEHGEGTQHLLPDLEEIDTMSRDDLLELREMVVGWEGDYVTTFKERVVKRLRELSAS